MSEIQKCGDAPETSSKKVAFITGIAGQDGSYLAELLLSKGYKVHGMIRRASSFNTHRINHLYENPHSHSSGDNFKLHYGDMTDSSCLGNLIQEIQPDEIYNLAAQSHVQISYQMSEYSSDVDALGVLRLLEAIRACRLTHKVRLYQASTSEMFGGQMHEVPQKETTPFYPRSPYGVAKVFGYWIVVNFREAYNMYACNGILFNHESPRRGENFVTRKVTRAVAKIHMGQQDCLVLGNLDAKRDWGHAKDYVQAMWLMLQQPGPPRDFVISMGETHSVREFVELAFRRISTTIEWQGSGVDEVGIDKATGKVRVRVDHKFFRPAEVDLLLGDSSLAREKLQWKPSYTFEQLVTEMVDADIALMRANPDA